MLITALIFLTGCSDKSGNYSTDTFSSYTEEMGASDEILLTDISNSDKLKSCFSSDFVEETPFEYKSHSITKRQTNFEQKEDIVFCKVIAENKYFNVTFDLELNYKYYDVGGWILENTTKTNTIPTAISPPDKEKVEEFILSESKNGYVGYIFENFTTPSYENGYPDFIGTMKGNNSDAETRRIYLENGNTTFGEITLNKEGQYALLDTKVAVENILLLKGNFRIFFNSKDGWVFTKISYKPHGSYSKKYIPFPVFEIMTKKFDYSSTEGKYRWHSYGETHIAIFEKINAEKCTLVKDGVTYTFNPFRINDLVKPLSDDSEFYYIDGCWRNGNSNGYREYYPY